VRFFPSARSAGAALVAALAVLFAPPFAAVADEDCRERAEQEIRDAYRELDRIRAEAEALRGELEPYLDWQAANREIDGTQRAVDSARDSLRRARKAVSYTETPRGKDPRRASNAPRRRHPA
jgi:hypothetical protein